MMKRVLFYAFVMTFFSCNLLVMVDRKQEKKFDRRGIELFQFVDSSGKHAVHFSNSGKPKLMLLHGYGASGMGQYYRSALELNKSYDLIMPDLLYCGKSVGNGSDFSIDAQVAHVKTILDSLKINESFVLVGNSYGGIVASYFAEKYPDKVKKLVVYDSPINYYTSEYADSLAKSLKVNSVKDLLSPTSIRDNRIAMDIIFHEQPYIPKFLRRQMVKFGSIPTRPVQIKLVEYLLDREKQFNDHHFDWKMPVYLCWGEYDVLVPSYTCNKIMERYAIPASHLYIFKDAAHAVNVEDPKMFVEYIHTVMEDK